MHPKSQHQPHRQPRSRIKHNRDETIGTINFTVTSLVDDAAPDITLGFYNGGIDGLFDNAGNPVVPLFVNGSVVPEPGTATLLLGGAFALWMSRRARQSS